MRKNLFRDLSIIAYVKMRNTLEGWISKLLANPGIAAVTAGAGLTALPVGAHAAGVSGVISGWKGAVNDIIDFTLLGALLTGVLAIGYGCKLIVDKSNDRGDVKNSHIVVSFAGGSFLCILWVIVTILVETSGGGSSDMGKW